MPSAPQGKVLFILILVPPTPVQNVGHRGCCIAQQVVNYLINQFKAVDNNKQKHKFVGSGYGGTTSLAF